VRELKREQHHRQSLNSASRAGSKRIIQASVREIPRAKADVLAHARGEVGKFRMSWRFFILQAGFPQQPETDSLRQRRARGNLVFHPTGHPDFSQMGSPFFITPGF